MRDMLPIFIFAALSIGYTAGFVIAEKKYQNEAAQTNCAQFNPETGEFEWIDDIERMIKEYE